MNTYLVHFKNKTTKSYSAFSYSSDDKKYYFHKSKDQSDKDSFALKSDVTGIENRGENQATVSEVG